MEDHAIDVVLDPGPSGRSVRLGVQPFTLVGATTREGLLTAAFRSRFGIVERLEPYPRRGHRAHPRCAPPTDSASRSDSAKPREALRRTQPRHAAHGAAHPATRARPRAGEQEATAIDAATAEEGLQRLRIDHLGLEEVDRKLLRALCQRGDAVGLKTLAAMIDEAEDTLEDVLEPHLIRCGLLARTPRGRVATPRGVRPPRARPPSAHGPGSAPVSCRSHVIDA